MLQASLGLPDIYKPIQADLARFSALLRSELASSDVFLQSIHEYLLSISGKHLRPALAIMSARLCGEKTEAPIRVALAIELLHTATLIHDDIIDGSMYRRNQLSMNARWGTEVSIICGDYLYAKAFSILSGLEDPSIYKMFSSCARTMCEGEMKQVETRKSLEMNEAAYLEIILKKTASLFQAACAVGGYLARRSPDLILNLAEYGKNFGMVFQITDDCMDIVGKEEKLGKKAGLDFEKNDPTLPLIYLYRNLGDSERKAFENSFEKMRARAVSEGIVERCLIEAREYAQAASASLEGFPDSPCKKSLQELVDFAIQRV